MPRPTGILAPFEKKARNMTRRPHILLKNLTNFTNREQTLNNNTQFIPVGETEMAFKTLDDYDFKGKTVLVRVDINSPLEPDTKEIMDDTRIRECAPTIKELAEKGAKVVVIAHQGRPGDDDFTPLEKHSVKLGDAVGRKVKQVEDICGEQALTGISELESGEVLLLGNVRGIPEENKNKPAEEQAKIEFVQKLSEVADYYVNDAFGAAHRSQPSLVGFGVTLPAVAGRLMERELKGLAHALKPERPCVYVLGGAKVTDSLDLIESVFTKDTADTILTTGLVGQLFLAAKIGDVGKPNMDLVLKKASEDQIDRAKQMAEKYGDKIKIPTDVVLDVDGEPKEIPVSELPSENRISDIGAKTIEEYAKLINESKTVIANGPAGVFENPKFAAGTEKLLKAMADSDSYSIVGGGHVVAATQEMGLADKVSHVSTGGGACLGFLSGDTLPVVEILEKSATKN